MCSYCSTIQKTFWPQQHTGLELEFEYFRHCLSNHVMHICMYTCVKFGQIVYQVIVISMTTALAPLID